MKYSHFAWTEKTLFFARKAQKKLFWKSSRPLPEALKLWLEFEEFDFQYLRIPRRKRLYSLESLIELP
jgi:hypothetical protein